MTLVLVYGSLKKGFGNHGCLGDSPMLGTVITPPEYTMYSLGGFPGVVLGGDTAISGEVYEVTDATLARLDRLEGVPTFYDRHLIDTPYGQAIIYILQDTRYLNDTNKVEDGVWKKAYRM